MMKTCYFVARFNICLELELLNSEVRCELEWNNFVSLQLNH